jgi:hypothetical protein
MTEQPAKLFFISDIHFGARTIVASELEVAFDDVFTARIPEADVVFINGDIFDDLLNFDTVVFDSIYATLHRMMATCEAHQVPLRILQGTWEHDRGQIHRLVNFYLAGQHTFDFAYFASIDVDEIHLAGRTLRVGFIPDSLPYASSQDIVDVLEQKMRERGWDYLDYACVHGYFDETFPKNIKRGSTIVFSMDQFKFVRKLVDAGHVHQHLMTDRFVSNGSFDRTVFGDEGKKGFVIVDDYPNVCAPHFVENTQAAVFDTIGFPHDVDTSEIKSTIDTYMSNQTSTRRIALRFSVADSKDYEAIRAYMGMMYPNVRIMRHKPSKKESSDTIVAESTFMEQAHDRIAPTPATLASFVRSHISPDFVLSIEKIEQHLGMGA